MKFTLVTYEVIDKYDNIDYIRYKYQIDDNKNLLEIEINRKYRDLVYNFIYDLANLYRIDIFRVDYKNMMYKFNKGKISEFKKYEYK